MVGKEEQQSYQNIATRTTNSVVTTSTPDFINSREIISELKYQQDGLLAFVTVLSAIKDDKQTQLLNKSSITDNNGGRIQL